MESQTPPGAVYETREDEMNVVRWQYFRDPNDINQAIREHDKDWELNSAEDIISITYDSNHGCYVAFYRTEGGET